MSLPRVLTLNAESELQTKVAPAAEQLRTEHSSVTRETTSAARQKLLDTLRIHDLAAELDLHLQPKAEEFTLRLQSDLGDFATISCSNQTGNWQLRVNTVTAPLPGATGSPVHLHAFLDGSVLEVFVNGTTSLTARIYQIPSGPLRLKIEGDVELSALDVWQMTPISKDRLTGSMC